MKDHNPINPFAADNERWKKVDDLIQTILSSKDSSAMTAPAHSLDDARENGRAAFLHAVRQDPAFTPSSSSPSLIERWVLEFNQRDWLAAVHERLRSTKSKCQNATFSVDSLFAPLLEAIEGFSGALQPAPAFRTASAAPKLIFQPRRRALEPADLPVFNPLFCTAVPQKDKPTMIAGLAPNTAYLLTLRQQNNPDWAPELTVQSSAEGTLSFDFSQILNQVDSSHSPFVVWFLTGNGPAAAQGWTSGLIWLESKNTQQELQQMQDLCGKEYSQEEVETLLSINNLITRGYYIKAYEAARQALLFQSQKMDQDHLVPLRECLWQFVYQTIGKILDPMQQSASLFKQIKPEWDAVSPLQNLQNQIRGRD